MTSAPSPDRPVITIDFDGVICRPPFGINLGIHRDFLPVDGRPRPAFVPPRWLGDPLDHVRFDLRRPLPGVSEALRRIGHRRRIVILTGRRSSPRPWMRRHGIDVDDIQIVFNEGPERSPHFKLEWVQRLGAREHVDDDARTAQLLAERLHLTVYLRDWPRNRGLGLAPSVQRVTDLSAVADRIASGRLDEG